MTDVACLRPRADFVRVDALPPGELKVEYHDGVPDDLGAVLAGVRALVLPAVGPKLEPKAFIKSGLQLVQVTGAGVDRLDTQALADAGIPVANVPGGSDHAVAEYVVTSAVTLLRRMTQSTYSIMAGDYAGLRSRIISDGPTEFEGVTVGVIGLGRIGRAVAQRCLEAGAAVIGFDPFSKAPEGVVQLSFEETLAQADVVTLHLPLTEETQGLIGIAQLQRLKAGAILINAARGGIVDEAALAAQITIGHLGGAAVDVFMTEPPSTGSPLLALDAAAASRMILTPHIAGVTRQSWSRLFQGAWDNVHGVLSKGQAPKNVVNGVTRS